MILIGDLVSFHFTKSAGEKQSDLNFLANMELRYTQIVK